MSRVLKTPLFNRTIKLIVGTFVLFMLPISATKSMTDKTMAKKSIKVDIKGYDWQGKIPESRLVVVKNNYGSIRSRNHLEKKIFLHANYQLIGDKPLKPEFSVQTSG